jgi:GMP synthase (glutamine-hydrolysing)
MKIHCIQHETFEGLAHIGKWILERHHELNYTLTYRDEQFPVHPDFELLIIMGGTASVYETGEDRRVLKEKEFIEKAIRMNKKVLGICFGAQILANILGAKVYPSQHREIGWFPVYFNQELKKKLNFLPTEITAFHWHGDTFDLPQGAIHLAFSDCTANQGFIYKENVMALQFHLEMNESAIRNLLSELDHTLIPEKFVQSDSEIKKRVDLFQENNKLMESFLDYLCPTQTI